MLQNYFELKQGANTVRRRNSINDPFVFYKESRVMCSYVYIKYNDGRYIYKKPVLRGCNFDPDKGGLYACYETSLAADELNGSTIKAVGFSASQSDLHIVNICTAEMVKTAGEPLYICGTMVLNTTGENFAFFPGDNKLVRMLLGAEAFSSADMSITCGTSNTPIDGYSYVQTVLPSSVSPVFGDKQISISKTFYMAATDVVLLAGGSPVLRVMPDLPQIPETKYLTAPQNDYITISVTDKVTAIEDLTVVTLPVDFTAVRVPSGLTYKKDAKIKLPALPGIRRDAEGRHFGYVSEGRAAILTLESGDVKISRFFAAADIMFAGDGAVFAIKEDGAVFYAPPGSGSETGTAGVTGEGGLIPVGIKAGDRYAVAYNGGAYVLGTRINGRALFYKIMPASSYGQMPAVSVLSDTSSTAEKDGVQVFAMPGCVNIVSKSGSALSFSPGGVLASKKAWLDEIVDASWFTAWLIPYYDAGRLVLYNSYLDLSAFYIDMKSTKYSYSGSGRFYGEFCLKNRISTTDVLAIGGISTFASADGRAACAVTAGKFLYLFMEGGVVKAYYVISQSQKLYAAAITQGKTVSYTQRQVSPPAVGAITLKIKGTS